MIRHFLIATGLLFGLVSSIPSLGQDGPEMKILTRAQKDKILIRWAPENAVAWKFANKYGYTLERYTILRDSTLVNPVEKTTLGVFQPLPKASWENVIDLNDYAAVAAQAIYGEGFELTQNYSSDVIQVVNKTKEQEQRFSFALYAADQSFRVAEMCGLAFTDRLAKKNERYLYKVFANIPPEIYSIDSASVYIGLSQFAPLPKPIDVQALFGDRAVMLKWNREFFEREYNSFIIERSEDNGKTFKRISKEPVINTFTQENPNSKSFYKLDSIENYKTYSYRVIGISSFGEQGPPSEVVTGRGEQPIQSTAQIINHQIEENTVNFQWAFDDATQKLIDGFVIQRGNNVNGPFLPIEEKLDPTNRQFKDKMPEATNYYRVGLIVRDREINFSFPYLVQLEDSIPPVTPINVVGEVDTLGVVTLSWADNEESDLQGYRVYRSNFKNAEFSQVTSSPTPSSLWRDTISLKNLSKKIYYKVSAVDFRNNTSEYSDMVEIAKPDIVPPVPPVFASVSSQKEGILLKWINSSSEDVQSHELYRRKLKETSWTKIMDFKLTDSSEYLDKSVEPKVKYQYTLVAKDQGGLESLPSAPVTSIQVVGDIVKFDKATISVYRDRKEIELEWRIENKSQIRGFLVYRAANGSSLTLYKRIDSIETNFIDNQLKINTDYKYRLKPVLNDGSYGQWSEELKVRY